VSWLGLTHKGTEPLYSDEWNRVVDALDILYGYVAGKLDRAELYYLKSDIVPDQDNVRVLGTEERSWKEIRAHYGFFKDNVYVQGKVVIKDGDPIKIEEFINGAKTDIDNIYDRLLDILDRVKRAVLQFKDGTIVVDPRFAQRIEDGYAFSASRRIEGLPNGSFEDTWFENPPGSGREINIVAIEVAGFGRGWIDIYRSNTKVAPGTKIEPINLNMGSGIEAVGFPEYGGQYTPGKLAHSTILPGGTKVNAIGALAEVGERLKIPPGYNILVRITNKSGTTNDFSIRFLWWEDVLS